jgi:hypothetical protein
MGNFKKKRSSVESIKKTKATECCQANMSEVAKDIIGLKFKKSDTLGGCLKKFYAIMEKHGIKQGTANYNEDGQRVGRTCTNFEWTMSKDLFQTQVTLFLNFTDMFNVPKNLSEYE